MNPCEQEWRTTPGGPNRALENRLIGVELTWIGDNMEQEELMMLVPPGGYHSLPNTRVSPHMGGRIKVTLHTSNGDVQAEIRM